MESLTRVCDTGLCRKWRGRAFVRAAAWVAMLFVLLLTHTGCRYTESTANSAGAGIPTERTGILIASDTSFKWGLATGTDMFPLRGNRSELTKYERQRVTVNGTVDAQKRLDVLSIQPTQITEGEIRTLIEQLKLDGWIGPENRSRPTHWFFNFTKSMLDILQAGHAAQDVLLQYLDDRKIRDQIIILLGGVGDERAVGPIIQAMDDSEGRSKADAKRTNLMASLALTNITQAEVIWGHGGGLMMDRCPDDPKSCWLAWWTRNSDSFKVADETESRNYSNYPNYGIYQQM
jgi:hypothetical protein